jgi:hypothetical protein
LFSRAAPPPPPPPAGGGGARGGGGRPPPPPHDRPLVLMEVGYPTLPGAAAHPWDYVPRDGVTADHEAQARCYRALFDAWAPVLGRGGGPARGLHCYCWDPYRHGEASDTGYGVEGKPALDVIRDAFARIRRGR